MSAEAKTTAEAIPATAPTTAVEQSKPAPVPAAVPSEPASEASAPAAVVEESKAAPDLEPKEPTVPVPAKDEKITTAEKPAAVVPEKNVKPSAGAPVTPLTKLFAELPAIIKEAEHKEMWGIELADESHVPSSIILEKFLRANNKDVAKAKNQLKEALVWRKKVQPPKLMTDTEFDKAKFGDLGYVTTYKTKEGVKEIITWNIYGTVKDNKETFGNTEE